MGSGYDFVKKMLNIFIPVFFFCGKIQEEIKFCVILGRKEVFLDCKNTLQAPAV